MFERRMFAFAQIKPPRLNRQPLTCALMELTVNWTARLRRFEKV
jgi:hypothetical protein